MDTLQYSIAFVCSSSSFGGLEMNQVRMAKWMQQRGHLVRVICVKGTKVHAFARENEISCILIKKPAKYFAVRAGFKLHNILKKEKLDIIFIRYNPDISMAVFAKFFSYGKTKIVYHQGMQFEVSKKDILHTIKYSFFNAWISTLPSMAEKVKQKTRLNPANIHVIPLGLNVGRILGKETNTSELRKKLGLPGQKNVLGILGRFSPMKGQDFVIECLRELNEQQQTDLYLLLTGEPTLNREGQKFYDKVRALVKDCDMENRVAFQGFTKNVHEFFNAIDVFIMSSQKETYGMVTVEALVSGIKVLGTDSGGTTELLEYGKYGWLYQPGNKEDFKTKLLEVLNNPSKSQKYHKEIIDKYSHKAQCEKLEELFINI
jgi:glycosyltransferase involved in cell wall biosynthesis